MGRAGSALNCRGWYTAPDCHRELVLRYAPLKKALVFKYLHGNHLSAARTVGWLPLSELKTKQTSRTLEFQMPQSYRADQ
jgi:hypothetical protein